jgi:hypothetical protein
VAATLGPFASGQGLAGLVAAARGVGQAPASATQAYVPGEPG